MPETNTEKPTKVESSENTIENTTAIRDSINKELYNDLKVFRSEDPISSKILPDLKIGGRIENHHDFGQLRDGTLSKHDITDRFSKGNEQRGTATADKAESRVSHRVLNKEKVASPAAELDGDLKKEGMVRNPALDSGNRKVYESKDGKPDIQGRTKVEVTEVNGHIQYKDTTFKDGTKVSDTYGNDGKLESTTTTKPDGTKTTKFEGLDTTSDTLRDAFNKDGAAGLRKEIEKVLKSAKGGWDKLEKMLDELQAKGVKTYVDGRDLYVNDYTWPLSDSKIATKPEAPAALPPESDKRAKGNPADAAPWIWTKKVGDAINKTQP